MVKISANTSVIELVKILVVVDIIRIAKGIVSCYCVIAINGCTITFVVGVGHCCPYYFH